MSDNYTYIRIVVIYLLFIFPLSSYACSTVIISGNYTDDGRPLMWKQFDNEKQLNKKVIYISGGKYSVIGIVNAGYAINNALWMGYNSMGFAIMSSDSGNLMDSTAIKRNRSGEFMMEALKNCASVCEFDLFLQSYDKPNSFRANIGVIDAIGNAFYYEVNNYDYVKYDVNDSSCAPNGYLIRTNFSFSGYKDKGHGYIRYNTISDILQRNSHNKFSVKFVMDSLCVSLENSLTGARVDRNDYLYSQDCITRYSTSAASVIKGVKLFESTANTVMWVMLGFPITTVAIPIWMSDGKVLPKLCTGNLADKAKLCDYSLKLKKFIIFSPYNERKYYLCCRKIINNRGNGVQQLLIPIRNEIYNQSRIIKFNDEAELLKFYSWLDDYLLEKYDLIFKLVGI